MPEVICIDYLPLGVGADELNDANIPVTFAPVNYVNTDAFLYGHLEGIDNLFGDILGGSLVKTGAAAPNGVVTPDFVGQIYVETTTPSFWIAGGLANTDWDQFESASTAPFAWAQRLEVPLGIQIPVGTATDDLTTDGISGGPLFATSTDKGYTVIGTINAFLPGVGPLRLAAAWIVFMTFKNEGGVCTLTSLTMTPQFNEAPTRILEPTITMAGTDLSILADRDQDVTDTISWFADLTISEYGL